jgi:hypothetical protein
MKKTLLNRATINLTVVALLTLLCAGSAVASSKTENLLLSAGFKAKIATTAQQKQELQTLPARKVSPVTQKGKMFYVYPDARRHQIYVGSKAQYQEYQNLLAQKRAGAGSITNTQYIEGNAIQVREFHGWGPLGE